MRVSHVGRAETSRIARERDSEDTDFETVITYTTFMA